MVRRKSPHAERFVPGTTFIINIPLRYSVSAPSSFHDEVRKYFKELKGAKCQSCGRIINKESFGDIIRRSMLKDIGVPNIDDLRKFPTYNDLYRESAKKFWANLPFKDKDFIVSPSNYGRDVWERVKKKLQEKK